MPVYAKGVFDDGDLPDWEPRFDGDKGFGHVAEDATTWTMDGKTELPLFEGLTDQERDDGLIFMDIIGTFYLVAHADYVRTVRLVPKGPESTDLVIDWLLPANPDDVCADTIERIKALPMLVIEQDGAACELNQQASNPDLSTTGYLFRRSMRCGISTSGCVTASVRLMCQIS